jgi:hypothetical protein
MDVGVLSPKSMLIPQGPGGIGFTKEALADIMTFCPTPAGFGAAVTVTA